MGTFLLTDLYQLTMAAGYWQRQIAQRRAVFHLFYRKNPYAGTSAIVAGLASAVDYLQSAIATSEDTAYLASLWGADGNRLFKDDFLHAIEASPLKLDVAAIPEGTAVVPHIPLVRVEGPLWQAQLVETALLTIINFQTLIATNAQRVCAVASPASVIELGLRRAQGPDGGLSASRAAYIGGVEGTSNVLAGKTFGLPVKGTHAHSWVMSFDDELEAFRSYARSFPGATTLLVDTYDTMTGVRRAIEIGKELRASGHDLAGIRLDSGDLTVLSKGARVLLDEAGFSGTKIVASNDLNEEKIRSLKEAGARIDIWGVGTKLVTGDTQSALGGVYKLALLENDDGVLTPRIKLSETPIKTSIPGRLTASRGWTDQGNAVAVIHEAASTPDLSVVECPTTGTTMVAPRSATLKELLVPVLVGGELAGPLPSAREARERCLSQVAELAGKGYSVGMDKETATLRRSLLVCDAKR